MDEILVLLDQAASLYHQAFPDSQRAEHFDAHTATLKMIVSLSADEESKKEEGI